MALNDPLSNALSKILGDERLGRSESKIKPISKVIKRVLEIMKENRYVGDFEEIKNVKGDTLKLNLLGNINKCGVIKPRYKVKKDQFEKFEERYLLAKDVGIIIVSTSAGIITHIDAKKKNVGGKLLAYCY
jgi:small subunit ribosomal protein S8